MILGAVSDYFWGYKLDLNSVYQVPKIAIFTKFDALMTTAYGELKDQYGRGEAQKRKFDLAKEKLQMNFIEPLMKTKFQPSDCVRLDG
jgi:hypothetical protein